MCATGHPSAFFIFRPVQFFSQSALHLSRRFVQTGMLTDIPARPEYLLIVPVTPPSLFSFSFSDSTVELLSHGFQDRWLAETCHHRIWHSVGSEKTLLRSQYTSFIHNALHIRKIIQRVRLKIYPKSEFD